MNEYSLLALFVTGLLGGTHCVGMCGGIVAAISMQLPGQGTRFSYHFAYNAGRILSYAVAGGLAGAVGASTLLLEGMWPVQQVLYGLANLMLVALGLYLAGLWQAVTQIERLGGLLWRRLQPLSKSLLPVRNPAQAFLLGTLVGLAAVRPGVQRADYRAGKRQRCFRDDGHAGLRARHLAQSYRHGSVRPAVADVYPSPLGTQGGRLAGGWIRLLGVVAAGVLSAFDPVCCDAAANVGQKADFSFALHHHPFQDANAALGAECLEILDRAKMDIGCVIPLVGQPG